MGDKDRFATVDSFLDKVSGMSILNYGTINICIPPIPITLLYEQSHPEDTKTPNQIETQHENENEKGGLKRKISPAEKKKNKEKTIISISALIEQNKDLFANWTNLADYDLIYDSSTDGLSSSSINSCICGKENVMIFIVTQFGHVFGCFNSLRIPSPKKQEVWLKSDPNYFIFTLVNPQKTKPMRFFLKDKTLDGLNISPNSSRKWVVATNACFGIKQPDGSYIAKNFVQYYSTPNGIAEDIFVGKYDPIIYEVSKVLAVQWKTKN